MWYCVRTHCQIRAIHAGGSGVGAEVPAQVGQRGTRSGKHPTRIEPGRVRGPVRLVKPPGLEGNAAR